MFVELPLAPITRSKRSFAGLISQLQSPAIFADPAFLNVLCDARTTTVRRVSVGGARYYKIGNLRWKYLIALALSSRCTVWKPHQKHPKAVSQISLFFFGGDPTWTNTIRRDSVFTLLDEVEEIPKESKACLAWPLSMAQVHASTRKNGKSDSHSEHLWTIHSDSWCA
jgi:hypothetical protein